MGGEEKLEISPISDSKIVPKPLETDNQKQNKSNKEDVEEKFWNWRVCWKAFQDVRVWNENIVGGQGKWQNQEYLRLSIMRINI